jgi:hypothetical protein
MTIIGRVGMSSKQRVAIISGKVPGSLTLPSKCLLPGYFPN